MVQGDEKKYIFNNDRYKKKYIYLLQHNAFRNDVEIISYCIMDNHAHILVFCPDIDRISKMMLQTNTSFGLYYNKSLQKIGHVFRERFKSEYIYTKNYLENCIKYILNNPVKAGMCSKAYCYRYSNYYDIKSMNERLLDICDFSSEELNEILKDTSTDIRFMDDDSDKEEEMAVWDEIKKRGIIKLYDDNYVSAVYQEIKKRCSIKDYKIAELIGIERCKMIRILKRNGIK